MGKKAVTGLLGAGLSFINGMNSAYMHGSKADRDSFPQWFKDMKGWNKSKTWKPAAAQPQQNVAELEDSNRALQSSYDREWESLNAQPSQPVESTPPLTDVQPAEMPQYDAGWDAMPADAYSNNWGA